MSRLIYQRAQSVSRRVVSFIIRWRFAPGCKEILYMFVGETFLVIFAPVEVGGTGNNWLVPEGGEETTIIIKLLIGPDLET